MVTLPDIVIINTPIEVLECDLIPSFSDMFYGDEEVQSYFLADAYNSIGEMLSFFIIDKNYVLSYKLYQRLPWIMEMGTLTFNNFIDLFYPLSEKVDNIVSRALIKEYRLIFRSASMILLMRKDKSEKLISLNAIKKKKDHQ